MSIARTLQKLIPYTSTSAETLTYGNEATTGTTVRAALDWIFASLYPNTKDSVDTTALLPATGNTLNDYRVVLNDGDGKAAGYRWEMREGDAAAKWYKIHDMDWSSNAILSAFSNIAHELYVHKRGRTDTDDTGNPIAGLYAGQKIHGGSTSGQNLTLNANSGDGVSAESGYVQSDNSIRPTSDNALDLGTISLRFRDLLLSRNLTDGTNSVTVANLKTAFDHVSNTSNPHVTGYDNLANKLGILTVNGDVSGSVDLSLSGAKTLTVAVLDDSHAHTTATITGFAEDVYDNTALILQDTTNITWTKNDVTNQITGDVTVTTVDVTDIDSPVVNNILASNTTGTAWVAAIPTVELTGDVTGSAVYSSATAKWSLATTVVTTPLPFTLSNKTFTSAAGTPTTVTATAHGLQTGETVKIFGSSFNGVHTVTRIDANTFTVPATTAAISSGYYIPQYGQLLYNPTTGNFQVAKEFEQISHSELSDLATMDDHTQYVAKDGRAGGQTVKGGTASGNSLVLESTSHATKGTIQASDTLTPVATAVYSAGWTGTNLGASSKLWNDLYMAGEAKGLRAENLGALPANSGTSVGRMVFFGGKPYWDTGSAWVAGGGGASAITSKVANYTATTDDEVILCSGTFTVSVYTAIGNTGKKLTIKNTSTGVISVDPFSSETIDGSTLIQIDYQYQAITIISDGANWQRI